MLIKKQIIDLGKLNKSPNGNKYRESNKVMNTFYKLVINSFYLWDSKLFSNFIEEFKIELFLM